MILVSVVQRVRRATWLPGPLFRLGDGISRHEHDPNGEACQKVLHCRGCFWSVAVGSHDLVSVVYRRRLFPEPAGSSCVDLNMGRQPAARCAISHSAGVFPKIRDILISYEDIRRRCILLWVIGRRVTALPFGAGGDAGVAAFDTGAQRAVQKTSARATDALSSVPDGPRPLRRQLFHRPPLSP